MPDTEDDSLSADVVARPRAGDRSAFEAIVRRYQRRVRAWAAAHCPPGPAAEQYGCALTAEMAANPGGASAPGGARAMARNSRLRLDRDPLTWQRVEAELRLPADADFLLVHVGVAHIPRFQKWAAFDGHFVDEVRVTLGRRGPLP